MFISSFIELLKIFNHINNYADNYLANYSLFRAKNYHENLNMVNDYISLVPLYKDFIKYYEKWFIHYYE